MPNPTSCRSALFSPRILLAGVMVAAGLCAAGVRADELCTLKLKDGRTITGILVQKDANGVTLRPEGGAETLFASAEIASTQVQKSPREEYLEKRAKIKDADSAGRVKLLLEFYYANSKSESAKVFAKAEVAQLVSDFPDSAQIKTLSRVMNQAGETAAGEEPAAGPGETASPAATGPETTTGQGGVALLSKDAQNLLRVYLVDFRVDDQGKATGTDANAHVVISKETVAALFKTNADAPELKEFRKRTGEADFRRLPPLVQLNVFFALRARNLYPKIQVRSEPAALKAFRVDVHPLLAPTLTGMLASQVPGLIARPKSPSSQPEAYTNFLALSVASVGGHAMIDRDNPEDSLLLQWALPRAMAKYPAPEIKGWHPLFRDTKDARFLKIARWIKTLPYQITAENIPLPAAAKPEAVRPGA